MLSDIDLKQLTETERDQILQVLRRDDELRKKEQERIRNLKSEVKQLRLKGVIREGQDATKTCARCREPFGWFFNTGAMCPNCQHRVCEKCRQHKDKNTWLCILCFRQMELEAMTNHWFYSKFRKSKRSKKTNRVISGSEIVRASFRRPGRASEDGTVLAGNSLTEEVKRALYNNNPNTPSKSPADGENSDTQSTEGLPPTKRLERVAFPEEEDKQLLMELIKSRRRDPEQPVIGQHHVEVKRVTSNRYRDSDSDSDSFPSSPQFSSRNESMFTHTDSLRSSLRSSLVSSDGRITVVTDVGGISDMEVASVDTMAYGTISSWDQEEDHYTTPARNYNGSLSPDHQGFSGSSDLGSSRSQDACSTPIYDEGYRNNPPKDYRSSPSGENVVKSSTYRDSSSRSGSHRASPQSSREEHTKRDDGYRDSPNRLRPYQDSPRSGNSPQRRSPHPSQSNQKCSPGPSPTNRNAVNAVYPKDSPRREFSASSTDSESISYKDPRIRRRANRKDGSRTPSPDDRHAGLENRSTTPTGDHQFLHETQPKQKSHDLNIDQSEPSWDRKFLAEESISLPMSSSSSNSDLDDVDAEASLENKKCKNPVPGDGLSPHTIPSPDPIQDKVNTLLARYGKGGVVASGNGGGLSTISGTQCSVVEEQDVEMRSSLSTPDHDNDKSVDPLKPSLPIYLTSLNDGHLEKETTNDGYGERREDEHVADVKGQEHHEWSWQNTEHGEGDFWAKDDSDRDDKEASSSSDQMEWDHDVSSGGHLLQHQQHDVKQEHNNRDEERERAIQILKNNLLAAGFSGERTHEAMCGMESDLQFGPKALEQWFEEKDVYSPEQLDYIREVLEMIKKGHYSRLVPASEDDADSLSVISEKTEPVDSDDENGTVKDESSSDIDSLDLDVMMNLSGPDLKDKITVTEVIETDPVPIHSNSAALKLEATMPYRPYHSNSNLPKTLTEQNISQTSEHSETESAKDEVMSSEVAAEESVNKNLEKHKKLDLVEADTEDTSSRIAENYNSDDASYINKTSHNSFGIQKLGDFCDNQDLDALVESQNLSFHNESQGQLESSANSKTDMDDNDDDLDSLIESNRRFISDAEMEEIILSMSYDREMEPISDPTQLDKQLIVPQQGASRIRSDVVERVSNKSGKSEAVQQHPDTNFMKAPIIIVEDTEIETSDNIVEMREKPGRSEFVDRSPIASVSDLKELFSKDPVSHSSSAHGTSMPSAHGTSTPKQEEVWWQGMMNEECSLSSCQVANVDPVPKDAGISPVMSFLKEFDIQCDTKTYLIQNNNKLEPACESCQSGLEQDQSVEYQKIAARGEQLDNSRDHLVKAIADYLEITQTGSGHSESKGCFEMTTDEVKEHQHLVSVDVTGTTSKRTASSMLDDETDSKVQRLQQQVEVEHLSPHENDESKKQHDQSDEEQASSSKLTSFREDEDSAKTIQMLPGQMCLTEGELDENKKKTSPDDDHLSDDEVFERSSSFEQLYCNLQFEDSCVDGDPDKASVANGHLAPPGKQRTNQRRTGDRLATVAAAEEMTAGTPSGSSDDRGDASPDRRSPTGSLPSAGVMASPRSNRSAVSAGGDDDDEENIDELFQSHASVQSFTDSKRSSNLLSPFTASRESIASYYSDAGEGNYGKIPVTGEVSFGLDYNYKNNIFEIHVKQCRDLAVVDTKKKRSDPYVKTYLLPDKTKSGKRKTRVKKHTLNPSYDETLRYQITKSELENRTLWLTVWHNDTFGRNDFLGEVSIPMDEYTFTKTSPRWYPLQDRFIPPADEQTNSMSRLAYKGDLIVSLKFVTCDYLMNKRRGRGGERGELQVLIKEARNLTAVRANGTSDPFCKGYLLPEKTKHAKQKTPVKKKDCNPTWNHTFVFEDIAWADLKERSLELTVWDHDRFTSNDFLGGVRLGLGTGTSGGRPVDWMDSQGEEVTIWKSMLERPNVWIDGTLILRPSMEGRK